MKSFNYNAFLSRPTQVPNKGKGTRDRLPKKEIQIRPGLRACHPESGSWAGFVPPPISVVETKMNWSWKSLAYISRSSPTYMYSFQLLKAVHISRGRSRDVGQRLSTPIHFCLNNGDRWRNKTCSATALRYPTEVFLKKELIIIIPRYD